ncbi:hypothetical protein U1Q18_036113, partial [Sarracenia purpurea var. burkii]
WPPQEHHIRRLNAKGFPHSRSRRWPGSRFLSSGDDVSVALPGPGDGIYRLCEVRHTAHASHKDAKRTLARDRGGRTTVSDLLLRV